MAVEGKWKVTRLWNRTFFLVFKCYQAREGVIKPYHEIAEALNIAEKRRILPWTR